MADDHRAPDATAASTDRDSAPRRRADYRPTGTDTRPGTLALLRRTVREFREDNMTDQAAALTYYGLLSLFPALIALVALVGLVADPVSTTQKVTQIVTRIGPSSAAQTFAGPIRSVTAHRGTAGALLVVGLAGALWSASGYVGAFMRASNIIFETPEGRPFFKLRPLQLGVTLVMLLLATVIALSLVLTGPIVSAVAGPLGVGSTAVDAWNIAKWPVMLVLVVLMFAVLFYAAPNVRLRGFRWVLPGALCAVTVWIVTSVAFAFYVAHFGSYDKTYGTLGGVVSFLVWLWITNIALLLGAGMNAERERAAELAEGVPGAEREIQRDARSVPRRQTTT